jgi:hypothetical protein
VVVLTPGAAAHRQRPWRVHALAPDFRLEDVWTFELGPRAPRDAGEFLACFWRVMVRLEDNPFVRTRVRVGRVLGWDAREFTLPIPGCAETSVAARLGADDRAQSLARADAPSPLPTPRVRTVYVFADEALYEVSNATIHALLHVGVVGARATLAVYVKTRGVLSRLYMAAIRPARRVVLYPALVRAVEDAWRAPARG